MDDTIGSPTGSHDTDAFNDSVAAAGYTISVYGNNGTTASFASPNVVRNDNIIVATTKDGVAIPGSDPANPYKLVGSGVSAGQSIDGIAIISLTIASTVPPTDTTPAVTPTTIPVVTPSVTPAPVSPGNISLDGVQSFTVTSSRMTQGSIMHHYEFTDSNGTVWGGIPLWYLVGFMDDTIGSPMGSHGAGTFNDTAAAAGYIITVTGKNGDYSNFTSQEVARSTDYLVAITRDGGSIPASDAAGPYTLVGSGVGTSQGVNGITAISMSAVESRTPAPTTPTATPTPAATTIPTLTPIGPAVDASTTLDLQGAVARNITQAYLASGVAFGHHGSYTDSQGNVWDGIPLWYLAGMVDDNTIHGPGAFNDALASGGYRIVVTARDGTTVTLDSSSVARNNSYLIANKKNGITIPYSDTAAPFALVGSGAGIGTGVPGVKSITLTSVPGSSTTIAPIPTQPPTVVPTVTTTPSTGGSISLSGAQSVSIPADYLARGASIHSASYTDNQGVSWSGIPLWYLAGFADDTTGSPSGHGSSAFNDILADNGYTITVSGSGSSAMLNSKAVKRSNDYIVANKKGGADTAFTLVGAGVGTTVVGVTSISLDVGTSPVATTTPTPAVTAPPATNGSSWNISIEGKMKKIVTKSWFEGGVAAGHVGTYKDANGKSWQGIPLWYFAGLADDTIQHGPGAFSDAAAKAGYNITIFGKGIANVTLTSKKVARSNGYLIANKVNGEAIPGSDTGSPVVLVGEDIPDTGIIGGVDRIVLTFPASGGADNSTATATADFSGISAKDNPISVDAAAQRVPEATPVTVVTTTAVSLIPTFTFKIAFTPFPEIMIQWGQPGDTTKPADPGSNVTEKSVTASQSSDSGSLALSGAINDTVTLERIQGGIDYGHKAEYTDADGNTWLGMPLWFLAGWVDDQNSHSAGAFNDDLAKKGYTITITGKDGSEAVVSGADAMRSDAFIISTTKNGERLTADSGGPLTLVGNGVPKDSQVAGVSAITLDVKPGN